MLLTVAPVLVPLAILGYMPIAFVNVRNNRARYELERELTELQRDRSYLEYLMTERVEAKEVRCATTSRRRLRSLARRPLGHAPDAAARPRPRRLTLTTLGSFVTTAVLVATLSVRADPRRPRIHHDR